jgi:hypothetical protein
MQKTNKKTTTQNDGESKQYENEKKRVTNNMLVINVLVAYLLMNGFACRVWCVLCLRSTIPPVAFCENMVTNFPFFHLLQSQSINMLCSCDFLLLFSTIFFTSNIKSTSPARRNTFVTFRPIGAYNNTSQRK